MERSIRRPNILLVLLDQWRFDALGANGGSPCRTPHLDALAAEGVRCTRAYTPIGICSAARASIITGLYPHGHGMLNNCHEEDAILAELPPGLPTFTERLAGAGYWLGYAGKWHVGRTRGPETRGFRRVAASLEDYRAYRLAGGLPAEPETPADAVFASLGRYRMPVAGTDPTPAEHTYTSFVVEEALRLLAEADRPFFLQVSPEGPHHPYDVPEPFASWYDPAALEPWPSFGETFEGKPFVQRRHLEHRGVAGWRWREWAPVVARYFGYVSHIDACLAPLLGGLREGDLEAETLVVVTADHGDFAGGHRQFNKGPLMYEDVYHVPLLARWPAGGIEGGRVCDAFVRLLDLGPTFLEAAGLEPLPGVHGRSLLEVWRDRQPEDWPPSVFAEFHGDEWGLYSQRMVRDERYKLVYNPGDRDELYDLVEDPHELVNLADRLEVAAERRRLELLLRDWMERTADPLFRWGGLLLGSERPAPTTTIHGREG